MHTHYNTITGPQSQAGASPSQIRIRDSFVVLHLNLKVNTMQPKWNEAGLIGKTE